MLLVLAQENVVRLAPNRGAFVCKPSADEARPAVEMGQALARAPEPLVRSGAQGWGPAPAPIARLRGRHRVRLLVRADR